MAGSSDGGTNTSTQLQLTENGSYSPSTSSSKRQSTILHLGEDSTTLPQVSVSLDCNQPNVVPDEFRTQKLKGSSLTFQISWYRDFKWLHVINGTDGICCFFCHQYAHLCPEKNLAMKMDDTFTRKYFKNWKRAIEKFETHRKSSSHSQTQDRWKMMRPEIQNEVLELFGHEIVQILCEKNQIKSNDPLMFSVICDGTQDVSGLEQESLCALASRKLSRFYQASSTTGVAISCLIQDILLILQLPLACLRGQTYDGAVNMSVSQKDAQVLISEKQLLVLFVYCGTHCVNLAMMDCCEASKTVKRSLDWDHEVGKLFSKLIKVKSTFTHIVEQSLDLDAPVKNIGIKIKPLCPTRWIHRKSQIDEIVNKYDLLLKTLDELSAQKKKRQVDFYIHFKMGPPT
ncbi:hypothetical protein PR048_009942 [Dryococelus australis]|uniref:TTF-type domain-containing protein n=1 Tax=Dryococelus australis TaxID=614101 RepID=A0ABQ9I1B2_9NEOP|nr:hypothetical protein PR048_009942 [Dryococelus australis]